jgi:hypothetical protein
MRSGRRLTAGSIERPAGAGRSSQRAYEAVSRAVVRAAAPVAAVPGPLPA